MNTTTDCDVLVVGAGPTGLTLAITLLARGVRTRVIDKDPGLPKLSRAIGFQARTLETLDMMGIAGRFLARGHPVRGVSVYIGGRRHLGIDLSYCDSEYKFILGLPQNKAEDLLRERLAELGGTVESGIELLDFEQGADGVTALTRSPDGTEQYLRAGYLVGCDGAHSKVRNVLDVPFVGQPYPWDWLLADTELDWDGAADQVHTFWGVDGQPVAFIPIDEKLWRVSVPVPGRGGQPPTLEEVQALVDARGPGGILLRNPETLTCFRCQIRSTDAYRRGRVFLAGDAAHIHAPTGAQGMNLGINDAANLGWKLDHVIRGQAADPLLDSYGSERGPAARQVLAFSDNMVRFAMEKSSLKRSTRMMLVRLPKVQRRMAQRIAQLTVSYESSPITRGHQVAGLPRPGQRMPNVVVRGGTLHEALRGGGYVLLGPEDGMGGWILVRPDGYIAAVASTGDRRSLDDFQSALGAHPLNA